MRRANKDGLVARAVAAPATRAERTASRRPSQTPRLSRHNRPALASFHGHFGFDLGSFFTQKPQAAAKKWVRFAEINSLRSSFPPE
jgi:hypothetical protein